MRRSWLPTYVKYGEIKEITKAKSINGTAHGDYIFTMCLDRGRFTAVPHIIEYENQVMTVVNMRAGSPSAGICKHLSKSCPQKTTKSTTWGHNNFQTQRHRYDYI